MRNRVVILATLGLMLFAMLCNSALAEEVITAQENHKYKYRLLPDETIEIVEYSFFFSGEQEKEFPVTIDGYQVSAVGDGAFRDGDFMGENLIIPEGVSSIGDNAFSGCSRITSISLPGTLKSIGDYAFYGCKKVENVSLPDALETIGEGAFDGCANLKSFGLGKKHPVFALIDGVLFEKSTKTLLYYPATFKNKSYQVPKGICIIAKNAFQENAFLTSLVIPDSVAAIGEGAFACCTSLKEVNIQNENIAIGERAFWDCVSLSVINMAEDAANVSASAFHGCRSLPSVIADNQIKMEDAEKLLNEGKYREAIYAYRMIPSADALKRSYELEYEMQDHSFVWFGINHNLPIGANSAYPEWKGSNGSAIIRQKGGRIIHLKIDEKVKNNSARLNELSTYQVEFSQQATGGGNNFVALNEWKVKSYRYSDWDGTWNESARGTALTESVVKVCVGDILFGGGIYALTADGTILSMDSKRAAPRWQNIVDIEYIDGVLYGLSIDGTLLHDRNGTTVEVGDEWKNLVAFKNGVGYRKDGSVICMAGRRKDGSNYFVECNEMKGLHNVMVYSGGSIDPATEQSTRYYFGLNDAGQLISTYPNSPQIDNVADYRLVQHEVKEVGSAAKRGKGHATLVCLHKDGTLARYPVEGWKPDIKTILPPLLSDEALEAINQVLQNGN